MTIIEYLLSDCLNANQSLCSILQQECYDKKNHHRYDLDQISQNYSYKG